MNWWHGNTSLKCFLKNVYCMLAWCVSVCVSEGGGEAFAQEMQTTEPRKYYKVLISMYCSGIAAWEAGCAALSKI